MYGLVILGLLATVICVHSNVSEHYFVKKGNSNFTCNWAVQIACNNSSLIDIHNVTVLNTSCSGSCTTCADSNVIKSSAAVYNTTIHSQILGKCNHQASCVASLPDPEVSGNKDTIHVTVYFNCTNTDTSTTKKDSGTTVSVFSSPTTHAAGTPENRTGIDTNTDTSPSKRNETTVSVFSSPTTYAADTSENRTGIDTNTDTSPSKRNETTVSVFSSVTTHAAGISENRTGIDTNTDTSPSKRNETTVSVFSSPTTYAAGMSENITGIDTNTDTSPSKRYETTVIVTSSPATQADGTSSKDPDTVIQPSSLNVVSAVVPTVLILVAITLVTVVIIARRMRRRKNAGDKTAIRSDIDIDVSRDSSRAEANRSVNVNGVQHSTIADDNGEYSTINLITFTMTDVPTYSHVNSYISNLHYENNNVSPLIDSDYASCADIDETVIVDDTYSHITNNTHTSNGINSNQGLTANLSQSGYDFIELANFNGIHADESKVDENMYSHIGIDLLNGRSLVDVNQYGGDYSHIGHVACGSEAECSTNNQGNVSEARSKSNVGGTCKTETVNQVNSENNECSDIRGSKERAYWSGNEINGADIENDRLYQLKECDDSGESNHFFYILEKKQ